MNYVYSGSRAYLGPRPRVGAGPEHVGRQTGGERVILICPYRKEVYI